ncbi:hypothetical protein ACFL03_15325 [Thermodesulfobacteriota bacterium]
MKLKEKIKKVLQKGPGFKSKFLPAMIDCLFDPEYKDIGVRYQKVIVTVYHKDYQQIENKKEFIENKRGSLRKIKDKINDRVFDSNLKFKFYIYSDGQRYYYLTDSTTITHNS